MDAVALLQRYWIALELQESPHVDTKAWDQSKIYLNVFKLNHIHHPQRILPLTSSKSPKSWKLGMISWRLQRYLCWRSSASDSDEVISEYRRLQEVAQAAKDAKVVENNEVSIFVCTRFFISLDSTSPFVLPQMRDLVDAIARVSPGGDWKSAVKHFAKLHNDVFESYRHDTAVSAKFGRGGYQSIYWAPTIGEVVEKEVSRIERELGRAERRKEWAIIELVLRWNELRKEYKAFNEEARDGVR